eukprot:5409702-Amphidinium_carterae.1
MASNTSDTMAISEPHQQQPTRAAAPQTTSTSSLITVRKQTLFVYVQATPGGGRAGFTDPTWLGVYRFRARMCCNGRGVRQTSLLVHR